VNASQKPPKKSRQSPVSPLDIMLLPVPIYEGIGSVKHKKPKKLNKSQMKLKKCTHVSFADAEGCQARSQVVRFSFWFSAKA